MDDKKHDDIGGTIEACASGHDRVVEREREVHFLEAHPELEQQLLGQWVALDGDKLISHGDDLGEMLRQARDAGHPHPFVTRVLDPAVTFVF